MTEETENYPDEAAMLQAKLRSGARHRSGWRVKNTDRFANGTYIIRWTNNPEVVPPKRQLTRAQLLTEMEQAYTDNNNLKII